MGKNVREIVLIVLINIFIEGPAVSFMGSPIVSPIIAFLCANEPFPPYNPDSIPFFALSNVAPPILRKNPKIKQPIRFPNKNPAITKGPNNIPTKSVATMTIKTGLTIFLSAVFGRNFYAFIVIRFCISFF